VEIFFILLGDGNFMNLLKSWNLLIEIVNEAAGQHANAHWRVKSKRHNNQKALINLFLKNELSVYSNQPIIVKIVRISPKMMDMEDNFPYACKWIKDSIADILVPGLRPGIADGSKLIKWEYGQEKGKPKEKGVRIEIYG
jgi:hypothetical protein